MTNNEAIRNLIHAIRWNDMPKKEALEMAIQALMQEPILDKIRAEIDNAKLPKNRMSFFRDGINTALEIIDKYRQEG